MDCPTCKTALVKDQYEGHPVFHCPECSGYLMKRQRMAQIQSNREMSSEELEGHAEKRATADTTDLIRCPRCHGQRMNKEKVQFDLRPDESFQLDICRQCQVIWFDGGELAKLQLDYESSIKAIDQLERQQLAQSLSGERKEQLEQRIAALPMASNSLGAHLVNLWPWIGAGALLTTCLGLLMPSLFDDTKTANYLLIIPSLLLGLGLGVLGLLRH
ncbi:MAG: zf-TFIIB domain-containing protein [Planctomycetota bacterium]|nr:zf-TFIIB domain-containing protein [Planctomycetota bacterium]